MSGVPSVDYERPVRATLHVHLDNGESWEATEADLAKFRLVSVLEAYMRFQRKLSSVLRDSELIDRDMSEAELNPLRYLAEIAIVMPELVDDDCYEGWDIVAKLERRLQRQREEESAQAAQSI